METSNLAKQITRIYLEEEDYYYDKMSEEEANAHHETMLRAGRIITVSDGENLAGYCEFSLEQGCVFINDLFIRPLYRRSKVIWMLKRRLFEVCKDAKVYLGERNKNGIRYPETQLRRCNGK